MKTYNKLADFSQKMSLNLDNLSFTPILDKQMAKLEKIVFT